MHSLPTTNLVCHKISQTSKSQMTFHLIKTVFLSSVGVSFDHVKLKHIISLSSAFAIYWPSCKFLAFHLTISTKYFPYSSINLLSSIKYAPTKTKTHLCFHWWLRNCAEVQVWYRLVSLDAYKWLTTPRSNNKWLGTGEICKTSNHSTSNNQGLMQKQELIQEIQNLIQQVGPLVLQIFQ